MSVAALDPPRSPARQTRQASLAGEVDGISRSVRASIASENPTDVLDWDTGRIISEVLMLDGLTPTNRVPLLSDHSRSVPSMVGSATDFSRDGIKLMATLSIASGTPASDGAWALIDQRHLKGVSVGYVVVKSETVLPGQSVTVRGQAFTAPTDRPLRVVTSWRLREVSLVPIPADETVGVGVRSHPLSPDQRNPQMSSSVCTVVGQQVTHMRFPQLARAALSQRGERVPDSEIQTVRNWLSSPTGVGDLLGLINAWVLDGFRSAADSTAGWITAIDAPNFLAGELATITIQPRLSRVAAGGVAPSVGFGVSSSGFQLARFGASFALDQQDLLDSSSLGVYQAALAQVGAAARRLIPDMVWATLLSNPTLGDGSALFAAGRGNLGTAVILNGSLDVAVGVIAGQASVDDGGDPVHFGLDAKYLIVPPSLLGTARGIARLRDVGQGFVVRAESRLTTTGVVNPATGEIVAANGTSWMLAAPSGGSPSIVVALLNGKAEPSVRSFELKEGTWGYGFDIMFDLAVCAIDGRPLFWSDGTV